MRDTSREEDMTFSRVSEMNTFRLTTPKASPMRMKLTMTMAAVMMKLRNMVLCMLRPSFLRRLRPIKPTDAPRPLPRRSKVISVSALNLKPETKVLPVQALDGHFHVP